MRNFTIQNKNQIGKKKIRLSKSDRENIYDMMTESKLRNIIRETIKRMLFEGGESAGNMELLNTSLEQAKNFFKKKGFDVDKELPNFEQSFKIAQSVAGTGRTKRKDMPVIDDKDVRQFQQRLEAGAIDIKKPFSKTYDPKNPFPTGLAGFKAKDFLNRGLKDGSKNDDVVDVTIEHKPVKKLKPIQKQIYFDKSAGITAKVGVDNSRGFLEKKTFFITSKDNYIIDGHHRYLSAMLIDPNMKVNTLSIDLPINKLLPLSISYGDSIGNKRNA